MYGNKVLLLFITLAEIKQSFFITLDQNKEDLKFKRIKHIIKENNQVINKLNKRLIIKRLTLYYYIIILKQNNGEFIKHKKLTCQY